ncbi:conjugal transfer mating pair stabilization protein TraN [Stutzerimonas stutzeri]|uniref:conjugal transfer mating pair stabilization protein TraN n=1 Tax=Stutzerimonas stutzeri TaxID=316 RepID=UPI0039BCB8FC
MRPSFKHALRRLAVGGIIMVQLNTVAFKAWADSIAASATLGNQTAQMGIQMFDPSAAQKTLQDLFPDLQGGGTASLEEVYGDDSATLDAGIQANTRLRSESSMDGEAYRILVDSGKRPAVDLSNDPMFNQTDEIRSNDFMQGFKENFADCSRKDVFEERQATSHIADYRTCERVANEGGNVTFKHDYKLGVVEYVSGQPNYQSCGRGCLYVWVGTVGNDYWGGKCAIYEEYTRFRVINKDAILSAVVEQATFDDYFQIYFNDSLLWTHTPGVFPPETAGGCERSTSWRVSPNKDVTNELKQDSDVITFKTRTSVTGRGEGYARIRINYDPAKAIIDNGWGPEERLPLLKMINDGFCKESSVVCTKAPAVDASGCISENGVVACQADMQPSPHPDLDPFCREAEVTADCSFFKGDLACYIDANGKEQCPENGGDSCVVNHEIELRSTGLVGKFAANGRNIARGEFDFVAGTWKALPGSDGTVFNGSVAKVDYDAVCANDEGYVQLSDADVWAEHGLGGQLDTSVSHNVITYPTCANGLKAVVEIRDQQGGDDGGKYDLSGTFTFRHSKLVKDVWSPQSCIDQGQAVLEGKCSSGQITVTKGVQHEGECATISGINICPGNPLYEQISASPLGTSRLAEQVRVQGCGVIEENLDTCEQYENDPNCGFISQSCIKGASGESGGCYAYEEIWDCGYDTSYPTVVNTGTQIECPGGARCMGSECFDTSNQKSGDFAYAVAMLQVAQFAEHDLDCGGDGSDIEVANECKIFKGEAMECKKALGGYVDCCEAPESVSIYDYVNLTMNTMKMASAMEALSTHGLGGSLKYGYWQAGTNAITSAGSSVIKGQWSTIVDNATGAFNKTLQGTVQDTLVSQVQEWLMQKAYDAMVNMGAEVAANAVFVPAEGGGMMLGPQATMVVNIIGWVYMVYVIVDLLINIIWECEEKEFELGAKKETRQCTFVGSYCASEALGSCVEKRESYCCYGSVVGRIVQEAAHEQLGIEYGDVENPSCEGITPNQMAQMDWSKVDMSEWIGMLNIAGHLPTVNTVSLEQVTGSGSSLTISEGNVRQNSLSRNEKRLDGFDPEAVKKMEEDIARGAVPD